MYYLCTKRHQYLMFETHYAKMRPFVHILDENKPNQTFCPKESKNVTIPQVCSIFINLIF